MIKVRGLKNEIFLKYFAITFLIVMFAGIVHAAPGLPLGVEVSAVIDKRSFSLDDKLMVSVTYLNVSDHSVELLTWETALNGGISEDLFSIKYLGKEISYIGIHVKRLAPTMVDYVTIEPEQSLSGSVDLLRSYPINFKGEYEFSVRNSGALNLKLLAPLSFKLNADRPVIEAKRTPAIQNCSVSQTAEINSALTSAERISSIAIRDLRAALTDQRQDARRYREWFGVYDAGRYSQVELGMARIANTLSNQTIGFDCDCTGRPDVNPATTFAFVFADDEYNMTLCDVFFLVRRDGTDSKSGTIVHEVSHFNVVAATRDVASNQAGIRSVAMSDPNTVITAANAYEYFAENTPFLSMPAAVITPEPEPIGEKSASIIGALKLLLFGGD